MKKALYISLGVAALLAFGALFFSKSALALSTFITSQGGTGTSSPSGILYGDNGATSHLNTVIIGSGCTFTTGMLSCPGTGAQFAYPFTSFSDIAGTTSSATSSSLHTAGIFTASSTVSTSTFAGNFEVGGNFQDDSVKSSLIFDNSSGLATTYGGTSCTNQFPRSMNAAGQWTCATVANTDLSNSSFTFSGTGLDVSGSPVALGGTLTVKAQVATGTVPTSGQIAYWGSAGTPSTLYSVATTSIACSSGISCTGFTGLGSASTIGLVNNILGGSYTRGNLWFDGTNITATGSAFTVGSLIATSSTATSTFAGGVNISGELAAPHSSTVPALAAGDVYVNTNSTASSSLALSDGTNTHNVFAVHDMSLVLASSTLAYYGKYGTSGTTTTAVANPLHASTLRSYFCKTDTGTVYVGFGTGSATTTETQCTSSGTNVSLSSNNTWEGRQTVYLDVGTEGTSPNVITITADVEDSN